MAPFDPFGSEKERTGNPKLRVVLNELTKALRTRADTLVKGGGPEMALLKPESAHEWIMEQIEAILEVEEWSEDQVIELSGLFFILYCYGEIDE